MRLFIAVELPPTVRRRLGGAVAPLRATAPVVRWVADDQLHVTLKFVGEQDDDMPRRLAEALRGVGARHVPFEISLAGVGAFPSLARPRVVWLGADGDRPLTALARDVDFACGTLGIPRETRPFRAHVTLGRVRRALTGSEAAGLAGAAAALALRERVAVREVAVVRSELGRAGARHDRLAAIPLGEA